MQDAGRHRGYAAPVVKTRLRLVLVDDHPIVLQGLEQLFGFEPDMQVVARCLDAEEALRVVEREVPDVMVLDVRMPGQDGLDVMRRLQALNLPTRIVLLTASLDEEEMVEAVTLGVRGIVLKEAAPQRLVDCIRQVQAGEMVVDSQALARALEKVGRRTAGTQRLAEVLTPREMDIVRMVTRGLRNRDIATRLSITEGTVKIHLHNVYEKLGVSGRLELVVYAHAQGLQ
jgi:DNA-binding NarL/FixJ family response regulator